MSDQKPQLDANLDLPLERFEELLDKTTDLLIKRYSDLETAPAFCGLSPDEVERMFDEPMPEAGMEIASLLEIVDEKVVQTATLNAGPNYFSYVLAPGTQVSLMAELLQASINQNVTKWHLGPAAAEIEKCVVQWGSQFMGLPDHNAGLLVSGGSAANLMGLTVARNMMFEAEGIRERGLSGLPPLVIYASNQIHACFDKSAVELGIGTDYLRKIPTQRDFRIDLKALESQIQSDIKDGLRPFCIVGNGGTVNTGTIDPLNELADLCEKYKLWFHIDGAYGGLAAAVPSMRSQFAGMERADSISVDFHKWLYQPVEAGCCLFKDWDQLRKTFQHSATYLDTDRKDDGRFDINDFGFQLSRNFKALKVWMSFKAYGAERLRVAIQNDLDNAIYLAKLVDQADDFELTLEPELSVTCFRYLGSDASKHNDEEWVTQLNQDLIPALEHDRRVFITGTTLHDQLVIRSCCINHRQSRASIDHLVSVIREVGASLASVLHDPVL
jgi:glutamate/tyrosine decarboxylase-like PLP-dependent enzyme